MLLCPGAAGPRVSCPCLTLEPSPYLASGPPQARPLSSCPLAMTDAEVVAAPPAVEDAAAPAGEQKPRKEFNHDEPLPPYDDALLVRVKGKVRKPVRPDHTERDLQIEKLSAEVKKAGDRIAEIKTILVARRTRQPDPAAAEHQKRRTALSGEWQAVLVRWTLRGRIGRSCG